MIWGLIKRAITPEYFVSIEWLGAADDVSPKAIIETNKAKYRGGRTVWRNAETCQRQGTLKESWLSDVYTKQEWIRDDANTADEGSE